MCACDVRAWPCRPSGCTHARPRGRAPMTTPRGRSRRPSGCMRARVPCASCGVQAAHVRARFTCTRRTFALVCPPGMRCVQQARPPQKTNSECVLGHTSPARMLGLAQLNAEARSSGKTAKRRAERASTCGTSVAAAGAFATFTCTPLVLHCLPAGFG